MTAEANALRLAQAPAARLVFLKALEPLPLVDPTDAACILGIKRHTLACYRNLGIGPAYYRFGRWIRYAPSDLEAWADGATNCGVAEWNAHPSTEPNTLLLLGASAAARYVTLTRFCLANYRAEGPRFYRFGNRVHYPVRELQSWARQQRVPIGCTNIEPSAVPKSTGMSPVRVLGTAAASLAFNGRRDHI